ncbi:hypothetical protein OC845_000620 [Tilletia horrida]|nr:hypothetical protein OC845_000620 [Tilletia horrida]
MPSFIDSVFESILQPGANAPTVHLMNISFYALFLCLAGLAFMTSGNIHVVFLLVISVGLWASINWFVSELAKLPPEAQQIQQMPDADASSAPTDTAAGPSSSTLSDEPKKDR